MRFLKVLLLIFVLYPAINANAQQWTASGTNIYNTNSGNVGIGLPNPSYKLVVQGEIHVNKNFPYLQLNSSYWNSSSFIQNGVTQAAGTNGNYMVFYNPASKGFNFRQGSYDAMTIQPDGKVGIGSSSPAGLLEIKGPFNGTSQVIINSTASNAELRFSHNDVYKGFVWYSAENDAMAFGRGGVNNSIFINSAGNVGIGTALQDFKLTVNGNIKAKEIQVVANIPADYVFEEDYFLKPLEEVEAYVKEYKHLPGIPSANEIKEQGWQVGEMSNKLLEKVEELTLHIIEQNKKINLLQEEMSRIKAKSKK